MICQDLSETSGAHGMIVQLAQSAASAKDAARRQIMNMIGGIPSAEPGQPRSCGTSGIPTSDRAAWIHGADYVIDGGTMAYRLITYLCDCRLSAIVQEDSSWIVGISSGINY